MSWIKEKRYRIVIIISAALFLCGFLIILLSQKLDGFPNNILSYLGIFMGMAGGGGIGAVISMQIISKRNKKKYNKRQNIHVNRLKKKAWTDFGAVCAMMIVVPFIYGSMTYADIKGLQGATYLLGCMVSVGLGVGFLIFLNTGKKQKHNNFEFDEREFYLIHRAINIGNNIFICYTLFVMTAAFYIIGGQGMVRMWSIPIVLFLGFFLAGTVQFLVLMHYAKEDDKNIEGGAA